MQAVASKISLVIRTIGAARGRAARGRPEAAKTTPPALTS